MPCSSTATNARAQQQQSRTFGGVVLSFLKRSGKKLGSRCSLYRISMLLISMTLCSAAKVWSSSTFTHTAHSISQNVAFEQQSRNLMLVPGMTQQQAESLIMPCREESWQRCLQYGLNLSRIQQSKMEHSPTYKAVTFQLAVPSQQVGMP